MLILICFHLFYSVSRSVILLSLVRTRTAGHLRDIRRLVVAMSRARLGLYVFGRMELFTNCFELTRTFNQLLKKPVKLHILPMEKKPYDQPLSTTRMITDPVDVSQVLEVRDVVHMGELVASMTLSVQSEYGEYMRRIQAAEEEERQKAAQREQALREYNEAREATRRADAMQEARMREIENQAMEVDGEGETSNNANRSATASRRRQLVESESESSGEDDE